LATVSRAVPFGHVLDADEPVRFIGVYDALSARVAEQAGAVALWASGLSMAASQGVPDGEIATYDALLGRLVELRRGTDLPILADGNSGFGDERVVAHLVPLIEDCGIEGVCLEDKAYPRHNSLSARPQRLARPEDFAVKVRAAVAARRDPRFLVVARVESLVAGEPLREALVRAALYVEAGADAVVVHSKSDTAHEVLEFARRWARRAPLLVIPTTYPSLSAQVARNAGIAGLIYANQLVRAVTQTMRAFLAEALKTESLAACGTPLADLSDMLELVDDERATAGQGLDAHRVRFAERYTALRDIALRDIALRDAVPR
jgi:2-methylisocitrate lyase-like PEP mutase family enzyme